MNEQREVLHWQQQLQNHAEVPQTRVTPVMEAPSIAPAANAELVTTAANAAPSVAPAANAASVTTAANAAPSVAPVANATLSVAIQQLWQKNLVRPMSLATKAYQCLVE